MPDLDLRLSPLLAELDWLDHGFGTKLGPLNQDTFASLKQIHSDLVLLADSAPGCIGEGDALVSGQGEVAVSIRTADCYPILLADTRTRAVAAIHAGWRGTAARIVPATIERMSRQFGTRPIDVVAAIGPGIGSCCYEVGPEVAERFGKSGRSLLDLAAENRAQLLAVGVPETRISVDRACTRCGDASQFHSFRRDGERAGRMISFIRRRS